MSSKRRWVDVGTDACHGMKTTQSKPSSFLSGAEQSGSCSRAGFLARLSVGILPSATATIRAADAVPTTEGTASSHLWKGRRNSRATRWDVITIGNLSRNRYWGESDAKGLRSAICTCTVVQGEAFRLIVDPSLANAEEMSKELDRRTGLKPRDITAAFITHEHGDHWFGLEHFPPTDKLFGAVRPTGCAWPAQARPVVFTSTTSTRPRSRTTPGWRGTWGCGGPVLGTQARPCGLRTRARGKDESRAGRRSVWNAVF